MYRELLAKKNVVGAGLGYRQAGGEYTGESALVVMVESKMPINSLCPIDIVPKKHNGFTTDVIEVGKIVALQSRKDKWDIAPPGVSIGHYAVTAGTFGAVVLKEGEKFILSNNHVMANSNDAMVGDAIFQPGIYDGGVNVIADLWDFVPIQFGGDSSTCPLASGVAGASNWIAGKLGSSHRLRAERIAQSANTVDCAIAKPINENLITDEILEIGVVAGTATAKLGMNVIKSGRTTGITTGFVSLIDASVTVDYGNGKTAVFEGQFVTGFMSEGGDSGSLLLEAATNNAVGLLYAGSPQVTIYNKIENVLEELGVEF